MPEPDEVRYGVFLTPDARTCAAVTMITDFVRAQFGLVSAAVAGVVRRRPSFAVQHNGIDDAALGTRDLHPVAATTLTSAVTPP